MKINSKQILKNCKEAKVECTYISDLSITELIDNIYSSPVLKNDMMRYFEIVFYKQIKDQPITISFVFRLNIKPILDELNTQNDPYIFDSPNNLSCFAEVMAENFDEFKKHISCFNGNRDCDKEIVSFALTKRGTTVGKRFGL